MYTFFRAPVNLDWPLYDLVSVQWSEDLKTWRAWSRLILVIAAASVDGLVLGLLGLGLELCVFCLVNYTQPLNI